MSHFTRHAQPAAALVVRAAQRVERIVVVELLQWSGLALGLGLGLGSGSGSGSG